jgi:cysteine desulfurase/selenocysteine lyase
MPDLRAANPGTASSAAGNAALPQAGQLEQIAAAFAAALDPSVVARMANALFTAVPGNPLPAPGAALPAAPVFSVEPAYASIPGAPSVGAPLTPNSNPGMPGMTLPGMGAAQPSAPAFAAGPRLNPNTLDPGAWGRSAAGAAEPTNLSIPSHITPTAAASVAPPAQSSFLSEPDFSALPAALESALSLVPRFDEPTVPQENIAALYGPAGGAAKSDETYYFLKHAQAVAAPAPAARTTALDPSVHSVDLGSLALQHRPEIALATVSGVRAFDPHVFRRDFPILDQNVNGRPLVWLDNGATTQKPQAVIDRLVRFYKFENSNVHRAAHTLAARSTDAYEAAREKVRHFINAPSVRDIIFVRGATEGINLVAQAWGRRNVGKDDEIVITHLEHHANIVPWQQLAAEKGARLLVVPVDDSGQVLLDEYEKLLSPRTRIVAFAQVSNALGTVTPAQEMTAMAHRHGAKVLIDGAQSISHMPVDVQALDADFFVFSGHKMFAPTGIGVVFGKGPNLKPCHRGRAAAA